MARKRNEEYIGDSDDGEFEEEPDFEDPEDFVDEVDDPGKKYVEHGIFVITTYISKCMGGIEGSGILQVLHEVLKTSKCRCVL